MLPCVSVPPFQARVVTFSLMSQARKGEIWAQAALHGFTWVSNSLRGLYARWEKKEHAGKKLYPQPMLVWGKHLDHGRWTKQDALLTDKGASHRKPLSAKHMFSCSVGTKQTSKICFCCAMCNVSPFYMPHCSDLKETYDLLHTIFLPSGWF